MTIATEKTQPEIKIRRTLPVLEQVESFKYLGTQITKDGRSDTEIKSRLAMVYTIRYAYAWYIRHTSALAKLQPLLSSKSISIRTKIRLIRAIVIFTALYGWEAWTLSAAFPGYAREQRICKQPSPSRHVVKSKMKKGKGFFP